MDRRPLVINLYYYRFQPSSANNAITALPRPGASIPPLYAESTSLEQGNPLRLQT